MLPKNTVLLANKSKRLGFVIPFKYCQWEGRFPEHWQEVPRSLVQHIAANFDLPADEITTYDLAGAPAHDKRADSGVPGLSAWHDGGCGHDYGLGSAQTRVDDATAPQLTERLTARYKTLGIEPPTPLRLARLAHSALRTIEDHFFTNSDAYATPETCQRLDVLLNTDPPACR